MKYCLICGYYSRVSIYVHTHEAQAHIYSLSSPPLSLSFPLLHFFLPFLSLSLFSFSHLISFCTSALLWTPTWYWGLLAFSIFLVYLRISIWYELFYYFSFSFDRYLVGINLTELPNESFYDVNVSYSL